MWVCVHANSRTSLRDARDKGRIEERPRRTFPRMMLKHNAWATCCLWCIAIAAVLFLASPASSQELGAGSLWEPAAAAAEYASAEPPTNAAADNSQDQNATNKEPDPKPQQNAVKNDRMFFVMPNYLTVQNEGQVASIPWKEKFAITAKGSFDPYEFVVVGILSGIRQAENAYPAFGQGMEGYGKRYGTAFADQVDGNIMVGAVFPTMLRTDPRYFQLGRGKFLHRMEYAFSRIFVTRRDSGGRLFNFPEFLGNATAITISNVYYPEADRGFSASAHNWGVQMGIDAFGNELKEFWPDIHRYLLKKKRTSPPPNAENPSD